MHSKKMLLARVYDSWLIYNVIVLRARTTVLKPPAHVRVRSAADAPEASLFPTGAPTSLILYSPRLPSLEFQRDGGYKSSGRC